MSVITCLATEYGDLKRFVLLDSASIFCQSAIVNATIRYAIPKACISHCDLQQMHVCANIGMRTEVTPHCGRRKIVKITGHPHRTIPRIDYVASTRPPAVQ